MERFGIRRTVLVSLALICAGVALTSQMRSSWQLVLTWGILVGLGTGTTAMVLGATVVSRWFVSRRGTVMGVLTDRKSTRLNSSHGYISYAVFCLKKKKRHRHPVVEHDDAS